MVASKKSLLELSGMSAHVETTIRFCPEGHSMSWSLWWWCAADNEMLVWEGSQEYYGVLFTLALNRMKLELPNPHELQKSVWNPWCAQCRKSCLAIKSSSTTTFTPSSFCSFHPFDLTTISERIHECQMCGGGGAGRPWMAERSLPLKWLFIWCHGWLRTVWTSIKGEGEDNWILKFCDLDRTYFRKANLSGIKG